eukprot:GHVS01081900.1.p1 GENE.GHVS01081900.1~~GHVS01081900.1.p1  ORF type:complete len:229 (+),score=56.30 GHVS01081900.1:19-705(+)
MERDTMTSVPSSLLHSPIPPSRASRASSSSSSFVPPPSRPALTLAASAPWTHSEEEMFLGTVLSVLVAVGEFIPSSSEEQIDMERQIYDALSHRHDMCEQAYPSDYIPPRTFELLCSRVNLARRHNASLLLSSGHSMPSHLTFLLHYRTARVLQPTLPVVGCEDVVLRRRRGIGSREEELQLRDGSTVEMSVDQIICIRLLYVHPDLLAYPTFPLTGLHRLFQIEYEY